MTRVELQRLHIGKCLWPREQFDEERIQLFQALSASGEEFDPVEAVTRFDGDYWVGDGAHRLCAALRNGDPEIEAIIVEPSPGESPEDCAFRRALETATRGPLQLSMRERHRAALSLLQKRPDLTHRAVAKLVGVSHDSVDRWSKQLAESANDEPSDSSPVTTWPTAKDAANRLVGALLRLEEARGFFDTLAPSRMGKHLAEAFENRLGDDAIASARRFAEWTQESVRVLEQR